MLWAIGAIVLFDSYYFRTTALNFASYWSDEMSSIHFAGHEMWSALFWDNSPPLYHFILKLWMLAFGKYEVATRTLSALISLSCTFIWVRYGARQWGWMGAAIFGFLQAFYSVSVFHGRETRMYSLFELSSTILLMQFISAYEGQTVTRAKAIFAAIVAAMSHVLAIFPLIAGYGILIFKNKLRFSVKSRVALALVALAALISIALYVRWSYLGWQTFKFDVEPSSRWPFLVIREIFEGYIGLAIILALAATSLSAGSQRKKDLDIQLFIFIFAVFAVATIAAFTSSRSLFLSRYFTFLTPILIYVVGTMFFKIYFNSDRARQILAVTFVVIFMAIEVTASLNVISLQKEPWRDAADVIAQASKNPLVYTPLPLSLRSPYFDDNGIELVKIEYYSPTIMNPLIAGFKQKRDVWLISNFWGYQVIANDFHKFMAKNKCQLIERSLKPEGSDPIILFQLRCPSLSETIAD